MGMGEENEDIYSKGKGERAVLGKKENFNLVEQVVPLLRISKENVTPSARHGANLSMLCQERILTSMDNIPVFWHMYKYGIVTVFVDVFCKPYQKNKNIIIRLRPKGENFRG